MKSKSPTTWFMNLWNVWAAFRMPNPIRLKENNPNGLVIAVLYISSSATGIKWYALIKSTLAKIVFLHKKSENVCMCGIGYLSGIVILFNRR